MRPGKRKLFAISVLAAVSWLPVSCICYAGPKDFVGASTHFGSGFLIQSFEFSGDILAPVEESGLFKPEQRENGRSARKNIPKPRRKPKGAKAEEPDSGEMEPEPSSSGEQDSEEMLESTTGPALKADAEKRERIGLSWNLGYALNYLFFSQSSQSLSMTELGHSFAGGLNWEALPDLDLSVSLITDLLPTSGYNHSGVQLHLGYLFDAELPGPEEDRFGNPRLSPRSGTGIFADPPVEVTDRGEWIQRRKLNPQGYFAREHSDWLEQVPVQLRHYPNFYMGLNFGVHGHKKAAGTYLRGSSPQTITEDQNLYQNFIGPEAIFTPQEGLSFRLSALTYHYEQDINAFLKNFEQGTGFAYPLFSLTQFAGFSLPAPVFPGYAFDQSVSWSSSEDWLLRLNLNETLYEASSQSMTFGLSPSVIHSMSEGWSWGGGAELIVGGATAFSGTLNLVYAL